MKTNNDQREEMQVEFQIAEVSNRFLRQLRQTTEAITHIYHSVINFNADSFPPLQTDSLPIIINDPFTDYKPELTRDRTLIWLFKKAFEEFIVGLTESLIEAHRFSKLYCLSNSTRLQQFSMTKEEIEAEILEIHNRPLKLNFPTLINEIEEGLKIVLPFKSEIISINQVRNCLVHRNGVVADKDINDKGNNCLQLCFQELITLSEMNGQIIEVKWEHKKHGFTTNKIGFDIRPKIIQFKKLEKVILDQNIFNGVAYTCVVFTKNLLQLLPRPTE